MKLFTIEYAEPSEGSIVFLDGASKRLVLDFALDDACQEIADNQRRDIKKIVNILNFAIADGDYA